MEVSIRRIGIKIKTIIIRPAAFWKEEKHETTGTPKLMTVYFIPLVLLVGAAEFAGQLYKVSGFYIEYPLMRAMREVMLFLLVYLFSVFFSNHLIKTFGGKRDLFAVRRMVTFSLIPVLLISIITSLFPFLYVLEVLGFYSFFIFLTGADELLDFPDNKKNRYILISLMTNFVVFSFLSIFLSKMVASFI